MSILCETGRLQEDMEFTIEDLLTAYAQGYFPMADHRTDAGFDLVAPHTRALLPIKHLHIPRRLRRKVGQAPFVITFDTAFDDVIRACANARPDTWINDAIINAFCDLHRRGWAHSVEVWQEGQERQERQERHLVGGLYGLALGSTFCGESMFSTVTDASKIALIHLCARLDRAGFKLLDSQFRNPHLDQFGLYEMPQDDYVALMRAGLADHPDFNCAISSESSDPT